MAQSPQTPLEFFELAALLRRSAEEYRQSHYREQLRSAADEIESHARLIIAEGRKRGRGEQLIEIFDPVNFIV
jgi:hypothetical protein